MVLLVKRGENERWEEKQKQKKQKKEKKGKKGGKTPRVQNGCPK